MQIVQKIYKFRVSKTREIVTYALKRTGAHANSFEKAMDDAVAFPEFLEVCDS
jgi:Mn-containing catalase